MTGASQHQQTGNSPDQLFAHVMSSGILMGFSTGLTISHQYMPFLVQQTSRLVESARMAVS